MTELKAAQTTTMGQLEKASHDMENLQAAHALQREQHTALQQQLQTLQSEHGSTETQLASVQSTKQQLSDQLAATQSQLQALQARHETLQDEATTDHDAAARTKLELIGYVEQIEVLSAELEQTSPTIAQLKAANTRFQEQVLLI